jgi:hypothetical protein
MLLLAKEYKRSPVNPNTIKIRKEIGRNMIYIGDMMGKIGLILGVLGQFV